MEMVRYMEVTRAQLPMGRERRNTGWRKVPRGPSSNPRDLNNHNTLNKLGLSCAKLSTA